MRTALRLHSQRRLHLDDAFLLFACAALTAATPLLYRTIAPLYFLLELASESLSATNFSQSTESNVAAEVHLYKLLHIAYEALIWTAIFSVKFSFLAFFRHIVDRIPNLLLHWKIVVVINIVACAFCVCFTFVACPLTGYTASKLSPLVLMWSFRADVVCNVVQCAYGSEHTRETAIAWAATSLDRVTDVLSSNIIASKNLGTVLLIVGSRQYPCACPLACKDPSCPEARHLCLPEPQHRHGYYCLDSVHRVQLPLPCVLVVPILVAS